MLAYFLLVLAVVIETILPEGVFQRAYAWVDRIGQEFEIDTARLGAPRLQPYQWLVPVLAWGVGMICLHRVLGDLQPVLAALLSVFVLLYGLRFKHFADVYTSLQLFLNQRDFVRAKALLEQWATGYGAHVPSLNTTDQLVEFAVRHGAERALRQLFCIIFWFFLTPGLGGLVFYMAVLWSVQRERLRWQQQYPHHAHPSIQVLFERSLMQTALSPRAVLFVLEWLPTRLLVLTIALMTQFDEVLLAWRTASQANHGMSNRALLASVCLTAVGVKGFSPSFDRVQDDTTPSQNLRQFRQLVFRCVTLWLFAALVLVVLG